MDIGGIVADLGRIFAWVVVTSLIFFSVDLLSVSLKRKGWSRFVSTFFLGYAQIIFTEFALGLFYLLNPILLVLLNIIISSAVIFFVQKRFGNSQIAKYFTSLQSLKSKSISLVKYDKLWAILLAIAGILLLWIVFLGSIFPATDFDGNSYHLTFIGNVIQTQGIYDFPTSLGWLTGYPKGGEFIEMWSMFIPRNDVFVELTQIPFLILGIYALYTISIRLGVNEEGARFSSLLFLFTPIVLNQLKTTYVDVILCSLFFAAIAFTIQKKLSKLDLLIVGIIYSLLISVKFTGFLFVAATVPLLVWNIYKNLSNAKRKKVISYLSPLTIVFLPTLFGFYWYIKNYILYGSPLYPFGFKLGGVSIFPGKTFQEFADGAIGTLADLPHGTLDRIWFTWTEQKDWFGCFYNYDTNFTGFGPLWFVLLIPAIITASYIAWKKKNYLYGVVATLILIVFAAYPNNYYTRYTLFITAIGIISFGIVLSNIKLKIVFAVKLVAIALSLVVIYGNFTLCNFGTGTIKSQVLAGIENRNPGSAFANAFGPAHVYIRNIVQPGDVIAYGSSPYFIYPLWRSDFSNKVIYLPENNEDGWMNSANRQKVKYAFVAIGSRQQKWLSVNQSAKSVYKDEQYEIFKLR